jgi:hypothetical protein
MVILKAKYLKRATEREENDGGREKRSEIEVDLSESLQRVLDLSSEPELGRFVIKRHTPNSSLLSY